MKRVSASLNCVVVASLSLLAGGFTACVHTAQLPAANATAVSSTSLSDDERIVEGLKAGNLRFTSHQKIHPRQDKARVRELANSQAPETIVVSCSDSRVGPELVFDQGLGDIFSVRTAGHALDAYSVASIEYAVQHLGAKVIMVLGHTSCGAIKAAATTPVGKSTGSDNIDELVKKIRPGLRTVDPADKELVQAAKNNVESTIAYLKQKSPLIRREVEQGKIKFVSALYDLKTGDVELW